MTVCIHHWVIEEVGREAMGKCKNCGEEKQFLNYTPYPESMANVSKSGRGFSKEIEAQRVARQRGARAVQGTRKEGAEHGTHAGYRSGCKCDPCRIANREYRRELKTRQKVA